MKQVLQSLKNGETELAEVPAPGADRASILVRTVNSVISAGTERMLVEFGRAGVVAKARSQPDKVKQVFEKVKTDGLVATVEAVRAKLDAPIPLGYCNAGIVLAVGERVAGFAVGDRVVTNGPHAEVVRVASTLAARVPDGVSLEHAAFTPLAAIGLQGLRLANPTLGENVVVYGLGLIGLLTAQLAKASGCRVIGIDRSAARCDLAATWGVDTLLAAEGVNVADAVTSMTGGVGADAVLLTLATDSDEPVHLAAQMARKRGRLVLVGVTGLRLSRDDFYKKELSFFVSCSYGPGRYDPVHEEQGIDYPLPFVRWTEARNFSACLAMMAAGKLDVASLISHRFPLPQVERAYNLVASGAEALGIVLQYEHGHSAVATQTVSVSSRDRARSAGRIGMIGAGGFGGRVLGPAFKLAGASLEVISSSGGVTAALAARKLGFRLATTDSSALCASPDIDTVVVATRHNSHSRWVQEALGYRKHVFVEKPLALSLEDVDAIQDAHARSGTRLCVGYNRRAAPHVQALVEQMHRRVGPAALILTVNAGSIPRDHWTQDAAVGGGRIAGEGCHFIDLARYLAGAPIVRMQVQPLGLAGAPVDDCVFLQLSFADGSAATIHYLANGHRSVAKERVEAYWDGKIAVLDNYRRTRSAGVAIRGAGRGLFASQDKGHRALVKRFMDAVRDPGAPDPIRAEEIFEVARWTLHAARLVNEGGGEHYA